jgi:phage shock protein PspC (stress-responsive transcriptional regulator)
MESKKLYRSQNDKMIAGVCSGLGHFFGIDPTIVRLLFVFTALLGASSILVYIVLWIVVPPDVEPTTAYIPPQSPSEPPEQPSEPSVE